MDSEKNIFTQYEVFSDQLSVKNVLTSNGFAEPSTLNPNKPLLKQYFEACIDNIEKRNSYSLFQGHIIYYAQVQNVYNYFRLLVPSLRVYFEQYVWKINKLHIQKFELQIQCHKCGDYTTPFLFSCRDCYNYSYCSENCVSSYRYEHQGFCRRNACPTISGGLPLEIHIGGHLYENIQVKYRHQERMSYKIKGKKAVQRLNTLINQSKELRKNISDQKPKEQNIVIKNIEDVYKLYLNTEVLISLRLILLREGCIFKKLEKKEDQDNIHLILHYLYPI